MIRITRACRQAEASPQTQNAGQEHCICHFVKLKSHPTRSQKSHQRHASQLLSPEETRKIVTLSDLGLWLLRLQADERERVYIPVWFCFWFTQFHV